MKTRTNAIVSVCFALAAFLSISVSRAQVPVPLNTYMIWHTTSDFAMVALSIMQYQATKERIDTDLASSRAAYWQELPNGPRLESARQAYSKALFMKDILNGDNFAMKLELQDKQIGGGLTGELAGVVQQQLRAVETLTGGVIEQTLPFAEREFFAWVEAFVREKTRTQDVKVAFEKSLPLYEKYAEMRDRAEFLFLYPKSPLTSGDLGTQVAAVLATCKYITAQEAAQRSAELQKVVADKEVLRAGGLAAADYMKRNASNLSEYTMDVSNADATICAAPAHLYAELKLANPYSSSVRARAFWNKEFLEARSGMDRSASRKLVLQLMVDEGATPEVAAERYARLTRWFDETLLLAAFHYAQSHSVNGRNAPIERVLRNISVFSLSAGLDRAFLTSLIVDDLSQRGRGAAQDSFVRFEEAQSEYERLVAQHGEARVMQAALGLRDSFIPYDRGVYRLSSGGETGYASLLRVIGDAKYLSPLQLEALKAAEREKATGPRAASTGREAAGSFAAAKRFAYLAGDVGPGVNVELERLVQLWDRYVEAGDPATLKELAARSRAYAEMVVMQHEYFQGRLNDSTQVLQTRDRANTERKARALQDILNAVNERLPAIEKANADAQGTSYTPQPLPAIAIALSPSRSPSVVQTPAVAPTTSAAPIPAAATYSERESIEVESDGDWYKATILRQKNDSYRVHYDGFASSEDEWVKADRMRKISPRRR